MKGLLANMVDSEQISAAIRTLGFAATSIQPIGEGGSARSFFRVRTVNNSSVIFVAYDNAKDENALYAPLADFLRKNGLNVPAVYSHNKALAHIVIQDLGESDLYAAWRFERGEGLVAIYKRVLMEMHKLHNIIVDNLPPMMPPFNEATFQWEREYFWRYFVRPLAFAAAPAKIPVPLETELAHLAKRLLSCQQTLIHRDFQSQNVMLFDGEAHLIDFQGMRLGNPLYDVASLLFDPYVAISTEMREQLFAYYQLLPRKTAMLPQGDVAMEMFLEAALERLLQALGAYGFLSLQGGKLQFLEHIPRALNNLHSVLDRLPQYQQTARLINAIDKIHLQQRLSDTGGNDKK